MGVQNIRPLKKKNDKDVEGWDTYHYNNNNQKKK